MAVYDADTMTAEIDLGFSIKFTEKLRLLSIDAWELRGEEREKGLIARDRVRELVLGKEVIINTYKDKKGKYGRYLAVVYIDGVNLNQLLLDEGHAVPYGS